MSCVRCRALTTPTLLAFLVTRRDDAFLEIEAGNQGMMSADPINIDRWGHAQERISCEPM